MLIDDSVVALLLRQVHNILQTQLPHPEGRQQVASAQISFNSASAIAPVGKLLSVDMAMGEGR